MSLNASIKQGKGVQDSNERLTSIVSGNSRQKRENILKKKRVSPSLMLSTKPMVQISLRKTYFSIFRCSLGRLNVIHRLLLSLHSLQISSWRVYHSSENYFRMVLMFAIYYYSDHYPPIDLVIQTGLVPRFTSFLSCDSCPELQYEAAWVLTNIASGNKDQVYILHLLNSRLQWW